MKAVLFLITASSATGATLWAMVAPSGATIAMAGILLIANVYIVCMLAHNGRNN